MAETQSDYMSDDPKKNPFATGNNKLPLSTKLILLLCGPFLVPWRIFFVIFFVWCHYMCALFGMLFPYNSKFRYWWMMNLKFWGRLMIFGFGHVWITESGKIDENVKCIVSNHVGYVDILYFLYRLSPSFIAKTEVKKVGMVGVIAQAIHCIFVDRKKKIGENEANPTEVKKNVDAVESGTAEIMKKWKQPGDRQKILLYPEGTTTNGQFLIHFHTGAFCMGEPVQPALLRYNWDWKRNCSIEGKVHPAYSDISAVKHALYIMSQPYTSMHVEYMDVYYPNEEEKKDPKLYAENVRKVMAARLGVPTSEHTFKEKYAYQRSLKTRSKKTD